MNILFNDPIILFFSFLVGMIMQCFYLLYNQWQSGDVKKILLSFTVGLLGMVPGKNEDNYSLPFHLFMSCVIFAFYFTYTFRDRLIAKLGGQMLLVWNVLFIAVLINHFGLSSPLVVLASIPTFFVLISGFSDIDRSFGWQVFFYLWFSIMVISICAFHFSFTSLKVFNGSITTPTSVIEIAFAGASFLYMFMNIWYIINTIPIPWKKHQSFQNRMVEVREHINLLAYGYIWTKDSIMQNFLIIIVLPLLLLLNYRFNSISESAIISFALVFISLFGTTKILPKSDGVGTVKNLLQTKNDLIN